MTPLSEDSIMQKAEIEIRYTIDQVAEIVGVHKSTLRYWGKIFGIETPRSEGNQRRYPWDQVELLKRVKALFDQNLTTKGVRVNLAEVTGKKDKAA